MHDPIVYNIFLVFTGAAALATAALFARQSMLVSYILLGVLIGPWGLGLADEVGVIQQASHIGVIFLLFLLGLNLHPQQLLRQLGEAMPVTAMSSLAFALVGFAVGLGFGFSVAESALFGVAGMFSSTIIGLKLLPTTQLHHQHTGEVIISILLLQDLIAILILLFLRALGDSAVLAQELAQLAVALPLVLAAAFAGARYLLIPLISRFDTIQEYVFLLTIGWCLGMAQLSAWAGLSPEIGAFLGGIGLATSPVALFIADSLRPLRDFFLVLFFFSLGATFDLGLMTEVLPAAGALALALLVAKPPVFALLLKQAGEKRRLSWEIGVRLGQVSEFSLFIAVVATDSALIGREAGYVVQVATLLTFVASSYVVMLKYPTPIAVSARLRRD